MDINWKVGTWLLEEQSSSKQVYWNIGIYIIEERSSSKQEYWKIGKLDHIS